jgi:D-alanyl-D-alanine carboxypeptidase
VAAYRNGEIPLAELTMTSIGVRLRADAAASVERMASRFRRDVGHALLASDGYRAMDGRWGQIWTFEDRYTSLVSLGVADRRGPWTRSSHQSLGARWWYRRPNAAAAAVPGTSNHGWATACDFAAGINSTGTKAHRWMNEHGPEYGWIWPTWAQRHPTYEPWHREYDPTRDQHRGSGGGSAVAAHPSINDLPTPIKEALMAGPIRMKKGDGIRLVDLPTGADVAFLAAETDGVVAKVFGLPLVTVDQREHDVIRQVCRDVRAQRNAEIAGSVAAKVGK